MLAAMSATLYGEHYQRAIRPFLSDVDSEAEALFLRARLPAGRLLDLGCGHGRHLARLAGFGIDRDRPSLLEARTVAPVVRADLAALPFGDGAFAGAWCWYNGLGTFADHEVPPILAEVGRCLAPGATLIVHGGHRARGVDHPDAASAAPLADGGHLRERVHFDPHRRRDEIVHQLTLPDGRATELAFFLRYYDAGEWQALLAAAGFDLAWCVGSLFGEPLAPSSDEIIVGATRRRR